MVVCGLPVGWPVGPFHSAGTQTNGSVLLPGYPVSIINNLKKHLPFTSLLKKASPLVSMNFVTLLSM